MSSEISNPPANVFPCPNCGKYDSVIGPVDANIPTHSIEYCAHCKRPYIVQNVTRVVTSVHKIEGIETPTQKPLREFVDSEYKLPEIPTEEEARQDTDNFLNSLPVHACSKCGRGFHAENPFKIDGEVVCSDCLFDYNKMCKFNPDMPRGIDGDDECIKCPGCDMVYSNVDAVHDSELCPICRRREENTGNGTHPDPEQYYCQECGCIYSGARECPVCDGDA